MLTSVQRQRRRGANAKNLPKDTIVAEVVKMERLRARCEKLFKAARLAVNHKKTEIESGSVFKLGNTPKAL